MAVEKSAVREGTRWNIREGALGRTVVVDEVTSRSVIFTEEHAFKTEAMGLGRFIEIASDPLKAEHRRLMDGLLLAMHDLPSTSETGKTLEVLRDTAVYLLERMSPTCPPYVEPAPRAPRPEPAPVIVEAKEMPAEVPCAVAEAAPLEDYAIAMPPDEPPSAKKRRSGW